MRSISPVLILAMLAVPAAVSAKPRLMVHLSRCGGEELKKEQVLVIDLSGFSNPQQELPRVLEQHQLIAIRERTISDLGSAKRSLAKVAKAAGKERCDAVIVMHRDSSPQAAPIANVGRGSRANGTSASISMSPNLLEVVFAELKPESAPAAAEPTRQPPVR